MPWRRNTPAEPAVEWERTVHELEPASDAAGSSLDPPPPPPTSVDRAPRVDLQRALLTLCAVVATVALVLNAMTARGVRAAAERQTCFLEAQYRTFAGSGSFDNAEAFRDALRDCGADIPDPDEDEGE